MKAQVYHHMSSPPLGLLSHPWTRLLSPYSIYIPHFVSCRLNPLVCIVLSSSIAFLKHIPTERQQSLFTFAFDVRTHIYRSSSRSSYLRLGRCHLLSTFTQVMAQSFSWIPSPTRVYYFVVPLHAFLHSIVQDLG